jgi:hypothetical protein
LSRFAQDYTTTHTDMAKYDILVSQEDRVKLLKAGFSGRQIEIIYTLLNRFEVLGVNWQPDSTGRE